MKIGFVTFCTENYIDIMNNLLESVLSFSKYDIIVYCLNFNYKHDSNRVQIKRIDLDNLSYFNICKMKLYATIDCGLDIGLILDCDMIPTHTEEDFAIMLNYLKNILPNNSMATNRAYYFWNTEQNLKLLNRYKIELNKDVKIEYPIEGCDSLFKIFKFENPSKIREFFDVWNHLVLETYTGKNHLKSGSWNILPEEILALVYKLIGFTVQHWDVDYASLGKLIPRNFPEDRYWDDWTHQEFDTTCETREEFIKVNYDKLKSYYKIQDLKFPY